MNCIYYRYRVNTKDMSLYIYYMYYIYKIGIYYIYTTNRLCMQTLYIEDEIQMYFNAVAI